MIPMGRITKDYLRGHRLTPHQCSANMFRILRRIDALNEQMNLGLSWHDVVHLYECHCLNESYYLKFRSDEVRLISYLPKSNKDLKDDHLIGSRAWHDGLHYPGGNTRWGTIGSDPPAGILVLSFPFTYFSFGFDYLPSQTDITLPLGILQTKNKQLRG